MRRIERTLVAAALAATALAVTAATASAGAGGAAGAVYTLTNAAGGNAVAVFARAADGTLTPAGTVPTGGLGSGGGLGSQGSLVLSNDSRWLFAVNAGSNEISALRSDGTGLSLTDTAPSNGVHTISLTVHGDLLYVLNAGSGSSAGNISGFTVGNGGSLTALAGSTRPLSAPAVGPAQVQFSPDGRTLVVTEKGTSLIDTYTVAPNGIASGPTAQASSGTTPFGFDFDKRGHLIVSDAFGGGAGLGALSSYAVSSSGALSAITPLAPDGQTAACWVVTTKTGRYAYTTNTGSANVSSYTIGHDGSLTLLSGVAGTTGGGPIDADVSVNSHYLYTLDSGTHTISAFAIAEDGSLTSFAGAAGLPTSAVGLAVR
jgi:6-phosphogluconolactonase (cycloisomerase 2 family)